MKFTNAELTARMISDQKNGWPFCPRCGKPLKIDPQTQRAASSNALSREVSGLYICDDCGSDEALRAFSGMPSRWSNGIKHASSTPCTSKPQKAPGPLP